MVSPDDPPGETPQAPVLRPRKRVVRTLGRGLVYILASYVALMAMAVAVLAIAGERTIALPDFVTQRLEARLNAQAPTGDSVALDRLGLGLKLGRGEVVIEVQQARLEREALADRVRLPELSVVLDARALLFGEARVRRVLLQDGILRLTRGADGRFDLSFGEDSGTFAQLPGSWAEVLSGLDDLLAHPFAARLQTIEADKLRVILADERSGRRVILREGRVALRKSEGEARLRISADLLSGREGGAPGTFAVDLVRKPGFGAALDIDISQARSEELRLALNLEGPPLTGAQELPSRDFLSIVQANIDLHVTGALLENGSLAPLIGRIALSDAVVPGWEGAQFDALAVDLAFDPSSRRLEIERADLRADAVTLASAGQVLLGRDLTEPMVIQLNIQELEADPGTLLADPVIFEQGVIEGRLSLAPFRLDIGQAMIATGDDIVRARGEIWSAQSGGLSAAIAIGAQEVAAERLKALWPKSLIPKTRDWFMNNLSGGTVKAFSGALRLSADSTVPEVTGSFAFEDASVRFLRHFPMATGASGGGNFHNARVSFRIDEGHVDAHDWGRVSIAGTTFTLPDTLERPVEIALDLALDGPIPAVLDVLNSRPFEVLDRAARPADVLRGQAIVRGRVEVPLIRNVPLDQVSFDFTGRLVDVVSDRIVPGRILRGADLSLRVTPEAVEVSGPVQIDDLPLDVTWRQPLPRVQGEATGPSVVDGRVALSQAALRALGIDLGALDLSGAAQAQFQIPLERGVPPVLTLQSDLVGVGAVLRGLGWSKARSTPGALEIEVSLGNPVAVRALSLRAPGLRVAGDVTLRAGGGLDMARFPNVQIGGWLDVAVVIEGQGAGQPPRITVPSGTVDLRAANFGQGRGGRGRAAGSRIDLSLDRMTVSDGLVLQDVRGRLTRSGGLSGQFTARVNGAAAIQGELSPTAQGTAIRVRADDAGAVLASAGLFRTASGGALDLQLLPQQGQGRYRGRVDVTDIRVRDAPALASLLSAISVVGLLEQLDGEGLVFSELEADFELAPGQLRVLQSAAMGPSMGITADGIYNTSAKQFDLEGVVSPFFAVNRIFGGLFARENEGLIGISYSLTGPSSAPQVRVNPLSVLTPGIFREIFRRPPPEPSQ